MCVHVSVSQPTWLVVCVCLTLLSGVCSWRLFARVANVFSTQEVLLCSSSLFQLYYPSDGPRYCRILATEKRACAQYTDGAHCQGSKAQGHGQNTASYVAIILPLIIFE